MSSIVCQGLPSGLSFDKLAPQKSEFFQPISFQKPPEKDTDDLVNDTNNKGSDQGWSSFILTLATNACPEMTAVETEYIHPLASWQSSSTSTLSTKSLEICTESLGSETGSNIDELIDDLSNHSMEKQSIPLLQRSKKTNRNVSLFPPPLTSISGSETTRVRPYRESGRLVLKATSSSNSSFQAERADGRLRLYSILQDDCFENGIINDNKQEVEDDDFDVDSMGLDLEPENYQSEDEMERIDDEKLVEIEEFLRTSKSCNEAGPRKRKMIRSLPKWSLPTFPPLIMMKN